MAGICESCGKVAEKLFTCESCGATVCMDCKREIGCVICKGERRMKL